MSYTRTEGRPQMRDTVIPRFHIEAVIDHPATAREGREIYKDEERIQFLVPGSPNSHVERVRDEHRNRWPEEYKAFRSGLETSLNGVPLEMWAAISKAVVLELKYLGFHTVEQVADMPDQACQRIRTGGQKIRELAKQYLDDAYAQAEQRKLLDLQEKQASENADLRNQIAEMKALVNSLHGQLQALQNRPPEVATYVQGNHDPIALAQAMAPPEPPATSALERLPEPRRRGRPTNAEIAARGEVAA